MSRLAPLPRSTSFLDRIFGSSSDHGEHQLQVWLEGTPKRELELDSIERDEDGDIVIAAGSAVVFIRTSDGETPCIVIFSPLLAEFAMRPEVYEAVNTINRSTPFAKAIVDPDCPQIVLLNRPGSAGGSDLLDCDQGLVTPMSIVERGLELGGRNVVEVAVQAGGVVPVHPAQSG